MRKVFAALTALLCLCGSMPVMAEESTPLMGTYEGLDWTLENHILTVSGDTNIYTYRDGFDGDGDMSPDWNDYSEEIYEIVIEEGVTGADAYALSGHPNLTKITLPSTFSFLEPYALSDNPQLLEINGLEYVSEFNFQCLSRTAYIAEHPFVITNGVLLYAEGSDLNVPDGVTRIAPYAFGNMDNEAFFPDPEEGEPYYYEITLPDSVEVIDDFAFALCMTMTGINIPDSVRTIGKNAFMGCASLGDVTLGENVESVGEGAFLNCKSLTNLTVLGNPIFGDHAYGEGADWDWIFENELQIDKNDPESDLYHMIELNPLTMDMIMAIFALNFWETYPYKEIEERRLNIYHSFAEEGYRNSISGQITAHTGTDAQRYAMYEGIPFRSLDEAPPAGDLNNDGAVDMLDVVLLNKHLQIGVEFTPEQQLAADFDGNGLVNATDSLAILQFILENI